MTEHITELCVGNLILLSDEVVNCLDMGDLRCTCATVDYSLFTMIKCRHWGMGIDILDCNLFKTEMCSLCRDAASPRLSILTYEQQRAASSFTRL